ncbi:DUF2924 domain-containing protein [Ruficoccus amylovorans]|uniref:DUF2924 domain-containing protein n=1 Tax=Ruficoccus amylovorans TaxID=1804625 RepID=A0A842HBJ3_9BACT|nr:DUF2924 domain-containing protein [Ruficoccus amylovorans]MBC2593529.1 DUF2924 domain-containing protein [Ruficoccus amylovorans]
MLKMKEIVSKIDLKVLARELDRLSVGALRERFLAVMGYPSKSRNRSFLVRKILWGTQAKTTGDISASARELAIRLADERDVITRLPAVELPAQVSKRKKAYRFSPTHDSRLPVPGAVLIREYNDRQIRVTVGADDFEFEGKRYKSLSAIAREVTGGSYNGFLFFKLK